MTRIVTRSALGRKIFQKEHILPLMLAHVPENDHVRVEVTPGAPDTTFSSAAGKGEAKMKTFVAPSCTCKKEAVPQKPRADDPDLDSVHFH